ncbi:MAG TPA: hypothetical protein VFP80_15850 [Thermoanaerobaculia bacterium]|nr:hypothetical protein [Thermoanaerobaculia bacterium]
MIRRGTFATLFTALTLTLLISCVNRVATHDAVLAAGLAELRASNDSFFEELQRTAGTPDAAWEAHIAWYEQTRAAIDALRKRAASSGVKDDLAIMALDTLDECVDQLEGAHATGFSAGEIPVLRTLFDSQLRMLIELEAARKPPAEVSP